MLAEFYEVVKGDKLKALKIPESVSNYMIKYNKVRMAIDNYISVDAKLTITEKFQKACEEIQIEKTVE